MDATALAQISEMLKVELASRPSETTCAIIGCSPAALDLLALFQQLGVEHQLLGIYAENGSAETTGHKAQPRSFQLLRNDQPSIALIAADEHKEDLITAVVPFLRPETRILIGGFGHFRFRDQIFEKETRDAFVPSFANGYPNSLIHIFQCLKSASRLGLKGAVAEFGMFKGGTTMLISRFIEALGADWKVYGFDTFDGFPPPRSPLDMYAHPDCVYLDLGTVQRFFEGRNIEIVPGDVVETVERMREEDLVLAFIDTDNYTSAAQILGVVADRIVVGGAIVFDHFTGRDRFLYTLGERLAAKRLLDDPRFFNLHDTGVFIRLR